MPVQVIKNRKPTKKLVYNGKQYNLTEILENNKNNLLCMSREDIIKHLMSEYGYDLTESAIVARELQKMLYPSADDQLNQDSAGHKHKRKKCRVRIRSEIVTEHEPAETTE